ncbi:unnamed protein product [Soboliphyme baturini]|uniref:EF-hand_14 domain-containing protein n=1 Tax=Soboliphyme baturini TaxID=241478 RepID=A0A183ITY5_9BILA|nr:unnamed protein product [Soboliphyme baturini]
MKFGRFRHNTRAERVVPRIANVKSESFQYANLKSHSSEIGLLFLLNDNGFESPEFFFVFSYPICQELKSWREDPNAANEDGIFNLFKDDSDRIVIAKFLAALGACGLRRNDPRLERMLENFRKIQHQKLLNGDKDAYTLVLTKENLRA